MPNTAKKFEINYLSCKNKPNEIVDYETVMDIIHDLESLKRDDVSMIHELNSDGTLGSTIWTFEEGPFIDID